MRRQHDETMVDAASIRVMLHLPGEDLVYLWNSQEVGFPTPVRTTNGLLWCRADIEEWAQLRRWRG